MEIYRKSFQLNINYVRTYSRTLGTRNEHKVLLIKQTEKAKTFLIIFPGVFYVYPFNCEHYEHYYRNGVNNNLKYDFYLHL